MYLMLSECGAAIIILVLCRNILVLEEHVPELHSLEFVREIIWDVQKSQLTAVSGCRDGISFC